MEAQIYLALYKGKKTGKNPTALLARFSDWLTRKLTKGIYSHCELVVEKKEFVGGDPYPYVTYDCYSSSIRDGGVRYKNMLLDRDKWDLIPINMISEQQIIRYFNQTKGAKYDWCGAFGIVFGVKHKRSRYFCSEWCFNTLFNSTDGWRFSPNDLAEIVRGLNK
ncbi:enoyl-CoA hydratase [Pasteurellaceae bacterium 22721_9_1]